MDPDVAERTYEFEHSDNSSDENEDLYNQEEEINFINF